MEPARAGGLTLRQLNQLLRAEQERLQPRERTKSYAEASGKEKEEMFLAMWKIELAKRDRTPQVG
jgi:hypothetical protein